jgi:hypothetical protein
VENRRFGLCPAGRESRHRILAQSVANRLKW